MKSLKKFISELQEPFAKGSSLFNELVPKVNYSSLWCCESPSEANYEEFLKHNSLDCTEESYKLYQYMSFVESIRRMSKKLGESIYEDGYDVFQKVHSVNENIMHSYDAHLLIDKLNKLININNVKYLHPNKKTTHVEFSVNKKNEDKLNNEDVEHLLHQYNYYVRKISETSDEYHIELEPYKPEELTDKIYNDFKGIIYHCTLKSKINKILNGEITPKGKNSIGEFRPKLSYYIIGEPNEARHGLRQIMNLNIMLSKGSEHPLTKDDFVFLKIDLNKFNRKIRFRLDSSGTYDKVITEEPIPGYCCEKVKLEDMKH